MLTEGTWAWACWRWKHINSHVCFGIQWTYRNSLFYSMEFLRFITVDKTWIHIVTGKSVPKKVTVFWDFQGVVLIDYLEKGRAITGKYCASLLGLFSQQDNVPAHTSRIVVIKYDIHFKVLPHTLYYYLLYYFLFSRHTKCFAGERFTSNGKVKAAIAI